MLEINTSTQSTPETSKPGGFKEKLIDRKRKLFASARSMFGALKLDVDEETLGQKEKFVVSAKRLLLDMVGGAGLGYVDTKQRELPGELMGLVNFGEIMTTCVCMLAAAKDPSLIPVALGARFIAGAVHGLSREAIIDWSEDKGIFKKKKKEGLN